jgi:hypothetical protein
MVSSAVGFARELKPSCKMEAAAMAIKAIATTITREIALPRLMIAPYGNEPKRRKPAPGSA